MTRRLSRGKGGCGVTAVAKLHVAQLLGRSASAVGQRSVGCGCSGVLTERPVNLPVLGDLTLPTACQPALQRPGEATCNFATADRGTRAARLEAVGSTRSARTGSDICMFVSVHSHPAADQVFAHSRSWKRLAFPCFDAATRPRRCARGSPSSPAPASRAPRGSRHCYASE